MRNPSRRSPEAGRPESHSAAAPQHLSHHHPVRRQPHGNIYTPHATSASWEMCRPRNLKTAMCHGPSRPHEDTRHTRLSQRLGGGGEEEEALLELRKVGWGNTRRRNTDTLHLSRSDFPGITRRIPRGQGRRIRNTSDTLQ